MANVTFRIGEDLLERARRRAQDEGTSLEAKVADFLTKYAGAGEGREAQMERQRRAVESLLKRAEESRAGSEGKRTWTRDELHERR